MVGINTASAGAKSGMATITLESDGTETSGLGTTPLPSQTVNVSGNVYRLASGSAGDVNLGNFHVGSSANGAITVSNVAANDGFSEKLNASVSGISPAVTATGGSVSLLTAGSNSTAISATIGSVAAGVNTGTVTLAYQSDGTGTTGAAAISAGGQTVNVTATGYRLASANSIGAVNFGSVHVGDIVTQALTISNLAANDGFSEKLNASFGGVSDARILTSGSISGLSAGSTNGSSMIVGLNTSAVGTVIGTATVLLQSDGTGTSGLGTSDLPSQDVGVSGIITTANVWRLASASPHTPEPVDFGNVRIGSVQTQALTIQNTAPNDGWSEKLNGNIATNSPGVVTATGAFTLLAPQSTNSSSLVVGINTASAGAKSGMATITLESDGTETSGLGTTPLPSQTVNVSGNVYRLANPTLNTPSVTIAARVGDAVTASQGVSITNTSPDIYTEGLKVSVGTVSGNAQSNVGTIANLAAGGSNNTSIRVGLATTAAAGNTVGSVALNLTSTGAGTTGALDEVLTSQSITINGKIYTPAVASVSGMADFGIVHVDDVVPTKSISVQNAAPSTELNDLLTGNMAVNGAKFTGGGDLGAGLGAGSFQDFAIGLNTSTAGTFNGTATFSGASHNSDMADLLLSPIDILLTGQVNNYAEADFWFGSGAGSFSGSGLNFTLDYGTVFQNTVGLNSTLYARNVAEGPADLLDGTFTFMDAMEFSESGFGDFFNLVAGGQTGPLGLVFDTSALGSFNDTIILHGWGHNTSGYRGAIDDISFVVRGTVIEQGTSVPEPATWLLVLAGLGSLLVIRRRHRGMK